jgi:hypothetical protein
LILDLPGTPPAAPAAGNLYQRLRALNNLPSKTASIGLPEAFRQQSENHS